MHNKPNTLKLSALFARYLYLRKQLNLPGIGVFSIDPSVSIPDPADKTYPDFLQQIKYEQTPILLPDEDLINFIRTETGKIKPLAESDLDSFLSDGKILLNIGKPFHIEGIGSLMKTKSGIFEFTPGGPTQPRLEGFYNDPKDDGAKKKNPYGNDHTQGASARKLMTAAALIIGLILIFWGGYTLYNRKTLTNTGPAPVPAATTADARKDSPRTSTLLDSVRRIIDSSKAILQRSDGEVKSQAVYKFIIERTANKARAFKRYQQLKDNRTGIRMESADSTWFSLYFSIPALPTDTARIRDSLRTWYARKYVFVVPG